MALLKDGTRVYGTFNANSAVIISTLNVAPYLTSSYTQANTATTNASIADSKAVTAGSYANSAFGVANTAVTNASVADGKAVTAGSYANSAYTQANTATNNAAGASLYANGAFIQANSAFSTANDALPKAGGTVTGITYFTGGNTANSTIQLEGYNQRGGVGYHGFLMANNTNAPLGQKHFRIDSGGTLQIIDSEYTKTILSLTDAGVLFSPTVSGMVKLSGSTGGAGTQPLDFTSGTLLTTPESGSVEYDGNNFYGTIDTTNGRGLIPVTHYYRLVADSAATTTTIAPFFGTNSSIPLVANGIYEIEIEAWFLKTTAGQLTWTITNSTTVTSMNIVLNHTPAAGYTNGPTATNYFVGGLFNQTAAAAAFGVTASLTNATSHYAKFKITLENGASTSLRLNVTNSAGTITPRRGSFWKATRIANVGTLAA